MARFDNFSRSRWGSGLRLPSVLQVALLLLVAGVGSASAQRPDVKVYTKRDGLPQSQILDVVRDESGYLWLGTFAGLSRYDGSEFTTWTVEDGLRANVILELDLLPDGRLLVQTGTGPCVARPEELARREASAVHCPDLGLEEVREHEIEVLADGGFWVATNQGIQRFAPEALQPGVEARAVESYGLDDGLVDPTITALAIHPRAGLWAGGAGGLVRHVDGRFEAVDHPIASAAIRVLRTLGDRIVIATDEGVFVARPRDPRGGVGGEGEGGESADGSIAEWTFEPVPLPPELGPEDRVNDAALDHLGRLWLASSRGLIRIADGVASLYGRDAGLPVEATVSLHFDQEQILWIGTDGGLAKIVPSAFAVFGERHGLPNSLVRSLTLAPDGTLWIGTRDGIAIRRPGDRGHDGVELEPLSLDLESTHVFGLAAVGDDVLAGTRRGLVQIRDGAVRRVWQRGDDDLQSGFVPALFADGDRIWVGTASGIGAWRDGRYEPLPIAELDGRFVLDFHRDAAGRLWLALGAGAAVLERPELGVRSPVRIFDAAAGLTDQSIWSIDSDAEGGVWLGSNGAGAFRIAPDGDVERLGVADGLVDPFVWQVEVDRRGDLWLYTTHGLHRWDGAEVVHLGSGDGLASFEGSVAASLEEPDGVLWFGTDGGLVLYDQALTPPPPPRPDVVLREARFGARGVQESGTTVPWDFSGLTLRFSALSFRDEDAVRFRWRLDDGPWAEPSTERSLQIASLASGFHRFEIDAANAGGWSGRPATYELYVTPPFWRTWTFRGSLLLLGVAALFTYVRLRERQLVRDQRRLESLVAERTSELESRSRRLEREIVERSKAEAAHRQLEERLRQSEKMEAVGRLAGGVAHDFNNLLTSILGYADLLATELPPGAARDDLEEIQKAAERASRLTHQLLAFSRRQVIEPAVLHLNTVVDELARMLGRLLGEDVRLELALDAEPDLVRVDRGHLEQVLVNLAVNARDSMPAGGRLSLRTAHAERWVEQESRGGWRDLEAIESGAAGGPVVVLEVEDDGAGMEPELVEHIFEPFFTTKERGRGTGLGLATVYGIVRQNGGLIEVESAPGAGSVFRVILPLARGEVNVKEVGEPVELAGGAGIGVLVVEDEPSLRALLQTLLIKSGFEVDVAADGETALARLDHLDTPPSLLISDLVMPGLNGRQVAERVLERHPDTRVLFISGYPAKVLGERGILPPGADFLSKPFTPAQLLDAVHEALGDPIAPAIARR